MLLSEPSWSELLWLPLGAMMSTRLSPAWIHVCPWLSCRWGLCWGVWSRLPLEPTQRTQIWDRAWGLVVVEGPCHSKHHTYMSGLCSVSCRAIVSSRPMLLLRAISGSMQLQSRLTNVTSVAMIMPRVGSATWFQVGVWGPKHMQFWVACTATETYGDSWARAVAESHIRVHSPIATRVFADVQGSCYHWRQCRHPRSWAMLMSEDQWGHSAAAESTVQLKLGTILLSKVI